ncbi:MAG: tRNA pseudouridine(55) synthase TruB [Armatimonadetes bacterium CG_4_10_14_3_um_filter_66_18]|nr:tRNA pseudouridine(55) synthase TruB [Armatimonadota bacterium]OIO93110.1 MAG: tRNA pseudouridine(55) synthase TruB [Armatimonadetes bacterium CG2_30_66_41]PIU87772.1 MAG: tRNA pseudouridine(55) synthase TruB [Armatimonadetes bacterium CG06_land_8_20_14_3_00_66_21]PIX37698.1 MAG: tRNA pseudouridine(55) synthase TruB [Armatimonadetes bacterium CG_4_8_14_3_um_filter_66_20]PIY35539.1 MAG: tRNA pseudouridine(55) synthase TruB [Armatimonadetes bacterium CG_4_10_14_3_um_filter_66_18]PIZ48620.1 MA
MVGLLNVLKPPGMTSHDVVASVRRLTGVKRVGHAGTLDPGAAGVLVVGLGRATRVLEYIQLFDKEYWAELNFGCETDSQDSEGEVTVRGDTVRLDESAVREALASFLGESVQMPPMHSALKHQGRPLYRYAREGKEVERQPRPVTLFRCELLDYEAGPPGVARFAVVCSSGTYVRTLCEDLGRRLGLPAHLGFLVRTAVGPFALADAFTLEALAVAQAQGTLIECSRPLTDGLAHLPSLKLDSGAAERLAHGLPVKIAGQPGAASAVGETCVALDGTGAAIALGTWDARSETFRPQKVLRTEGED